MLQILKQFSTNFYSTSRKTKIKNLASLPLIVPSIEPDVSPELFGDDFQKVMNFLNRVSSVIGVEIPRPEIVESTKNNQHPKYEVIAHNSIDISEKYSFLFKSDVQSLKRLTFAARAKSINEAKKLALRNLAESLFTLLRPAQLFLPVSEQDPKKVSPHISFNPTKVQIENLNSAINACMASLESIRVEEPISQKFNPFSEINDIISQECSIKLQDIGKPPPLSGMLPIYTHYQEIVSSLEENQVTIVSATTGSGKTTQIPKIILHHFQNSNPKIIVTQPRRVAAISLASRLAHELGEPYVGQSVGYSVRFDSVFPKKLDSNIRKFFNLLLLKLLLF